MFTSGFQICLKKGTEAILCQYLLFIHQIFSMNKDLFDRTLNYMSEFFVKTQKTPGHLPGGLQFHHLMAAVWAAGSPARC
jgi:hypothetical protein